MLDIEECERARVRRDRRFDGLFFFWRSHDTYLLPPCLSGAPCQGGQRNILSVGSGGRTCGFPTVSEVQAGRLLLSRLHGREHAPLSNVRSGSSRTVHLMTAVSRLWPIVSGSVRDICPGSSKCTSVQARFRSPRRHACSGRSGFWTRPISRCRRSPCAQASVVCGDSIRYSLRFIGDRQRRSGVPANRVPRKRRLPVEADRSSAERTRLLLAHSVVALLCSNTSAIEA